MQDVEIRKALHSYLKDINRTIKDTIIVDELDLCSGLSRIDVAVVNGIIHGYEIKSEEDTLNRLDKQIKNYNKSLEKISIATNPSHLNNIKKRIPKWWGIIVVEKNDEQIQIKEIKEARNNPHIQAKSILELLWKEELYKVANHYQIHFKKNFTRRVMRNEISQKLKIEQITYEVRDALKSRKNWRS